MMKYAKSLMALLCVGAVVGCDTGISEPEIPAAPQADLLNLGVDNLLGADGLLDMLALMEKYPDAKAIVVGKADLEAAADPSTLVQEYQFHVVRHHDLRFTGRFKMHYTDASGGAADVYGDVRCLNFVGDVVEVGGIITDVSAGTNVPGIERGAPMVWKVQDNGEGAPDPPDLASAMAIGSMSPSTFPATFCTGPNLALFPQDEGNIQVNRR